MSEPWRTYLVRGSELEAKVAEVARLRTALKRLLTEAVADSGAVPLEDWNFAVAALGETEAE